MTCTILFMAALWKRAGHYIFTLWFLSSSIFFYSSPNLSGRRLDVYHTSTHDVALVRIHHTVGTHREILLFNKFFPIVDTCLSCEDIARQSCAMAPRR